MWYFSEEELLLLHYKLIEMFGGSHGVRDHARIKSVLQSPMQKFQDHEQYASIYEKAAVYSRNIIGDHPFIDGNKRTGISAAILFLTKNDINVKIPTGDLEDFAVKIATDKLSINEIADWLEDKAAS